MPLGIGLGIATGIANTLGQNAREKRSYNNQKKLMGIQNSNQRGLNEQGQKLGMKTWRETNYGPQMEEMRKAGLNPALMYGQGGAGGTTSSGSGGSAASGSAPSPQMMDIKSGLGEAVNAAQMRNLEANTRNTEASAESQEIDNVTKQGSGKDADRVEASNRYDEAVQKGQYMFEKGEGSRKENSEGDTPYIEGIRSENEKKTIDKDIATMVKKGIVSENDVKAYKAELARGKIDPDSNPIVREIMKAMQANGIPMNEIFAKILKMFM